MSRIAGAKQVVTAPDATTHHLDAEERFARPRESRSPF